MVWVVSHILTNLYNLTLGDNQFSEIPEVIYSMTNLRELNMYVNQISNISDNIGVTL